MELTGWLGYCGGSFAVGVGSVAAGSLGFSLGRFLVLGGSGRLLRFAAIVTAPRLLGATP